MARSRTKRSLPSPHEVLKGSKNATMEQLFALIHEVNPTEAETSEHEKKKRYALKATLQSLLIERHPDELEVEPCADLGENIVSLRHRSGHADACHARLDELEPGARSWVQRQLDLGAAAQPGAKETGKRGKRSSAPTDFGGDLLGQAARMLEEFDFERARELLIEALEAAQARCSERVAVRAARALLDLLVDQLAENAAALSWMSRLQDAVLADSEVRCLLALAAARDSAPEQARRLLQGVASERVGEVRVELARAALAQGDFAAAERELGQVEAASAWSARAQALLADVREQKVEAGRLLEQRLEEARGAGETRKTKKIARQILELDPGSVLARRTLRELGRKERARVAAAQAGAIESALAASDPVRAARIYREARALAERRPDLEARIEKALEERRQARARARIENVIAELRGGVSAGAVEAFWQLDDEAREAVRGKVGGGDMFWIEELGPVKGRPRCRDVAAAVSALARVKRDEEPEGLAECERVLGGLEPLLRGSAEARGLLRRLRQRLAAERHESARSLLERAERRVEQDAHEAQVLLDAVAPADLDADGKARYEALRQRIERAEDVRWHRSSFERWIAENDLFAARLLARLLETLVEGSEAEEWRVESARLSGAIRRDWLLEEVEGEVVADEIPDVQPVPAAGPEAWLLPGGRQVVLCRADAEFVLIRVVDLDEPGRSRAAYFRTPEPLGHVEWQVDGGTVWLLGEPGLVLRVEPSTWDVWAWHDLRTFRGVEKLGETIGIAGSRYVWVGGKDDRRAQVLDLDQGRVERQIRCFLADVVHGISPVRVTLSMEIEHGMALCDARGAVLWQAAPEGERIEGAVVHPSGESILLLLAVEGEDSESTEEWPLALRELRNDGDLGTQVVFGASDAALLHMAATSLEHGRTFLAFSAFDAPSQLIELVAGEQGLREVSRIEIDRVPCLAQDPEARHVVALGGDGQHLRFVRLDAGIAGFPRSGWEGDFAFVPSGVDPALLCGVGSQHHAEALHVETFLDQVPAEAVDNELRRLARDIRLNKLALLQGCPSHAGEAVLREIAESLDPWDRDMGTLLLAEHALRADRPEDALRILQGSDPSGLEPRLRQHHHHVLGYVALVLGDAARAVRELEAAVALDTDSCRVEGLVAWCRALCEPEELLDRSRSAGGTREFVARIRLADRALAAGELGEVVALLDTRLMWRQMARQTSARRAEAYLALSSEDPWFRIRKRRALAALVGSRPNEIHRALLGSWTWSQERIAAVEERAREWLDRG